MKSVGLAFVSLLLAFSAYAQQAPAAKKGAQPGQIRGPCAEDAAKLCKDVTPGSGRIIACLQGQADKLSPACKTQVTRAQQRQQAREKKAGPAAQAPGKKSAQTGAAKKGAQPEAAKTAPATEPTKDAAKQ